MKLISFTALHYGVSYLGFALKSVLPYVDEAWVLYSDIGSHGFRTEVVRLGSGYPIRVFGAI